MRWVCVLALFLIHVLFGLARTLAELGSAVASFASSGILHARFGGDEARCIREGLPGKRPQRVVLVLGHRNSGAIRFRQIAKLLKWLSFARVERVAVYDREGEVKKGIDRLKFHLLKEVEDGKGGLSRMDVHNLDLSKHSFRLISNSTSKPGMGSDSHTPLIDGFIDSKSEEEMKVEIFSKEDGKSAMANAISLLIQTSLSRRGAAEFGEYEHKEYCGVTENKETKDDQSKTCNENNASKPVNQVDYKNRNFFDALYPRITKMDIQKGLSAVGGLSWEPDAILVFGDFVSLEGFSPWHNGNCEIIFMKKLKYLNLATFLYALSTFSKTTQRFGK